MGPSHLLDSPSILAIGLDYRLACVQRSTPMLRLISVWPNFQNNCRAIAERKVCSCAYIFKFFYRPSRFSLIGKFISKITILAILGAVSPHF